MSRKEFLSSWLDDADVEIEEALNPKILSKWCSSHSLEPTVQEHYRSVWNQSVGDDIHSLTDPEEATAQVILLHFVTRQLHPKSSQAYQHDDKASTLVKKLCANSTDEQLTPLKRMFLYLALAQTENIGSLYEAEKRFTFLSREYPKSYGGLFAKCLEYSKNNQKVFNRFGRFPTRNPYLQRSTTTQETKFLQEELPGYDDEILCRELAEFQLNNQ